MTYHWDGEEFPTLADARGAIADHLASQLSDEDAEVVTSEGRWNYGVRVRIELVRQ